MADTPLTNLDTVSSTDRTAAGSQPDFSTPTGTIATGSSGTVTGVSASSPLTSSGGTSPNIAIASQTANKVLAGPTTGTAAPTFRALVAADVPTLSYLTSIAGSEFTLTPGGTGPAVNIATNNINPNFARIGAGATINGGMKATIQGAQGNPSNSGTTQTYGNYRVQTGNTVMDVGTRTSGKTWLQSYDATDLSLHYGIELNPLGGDTELGGTTGESFGQTKGARTGEVLRTWKSRIDDVFNVEDYGASASASAATNQTAIQAALYAIAAAGGGCLYLPGKYNINNTLDATALTGSLSIIGNGCGVSQLHQTVANKGIFNIASSAVEGIVTLSGFACANDSGTSLSSVSAITVDFTYTTSQFRGCNLRVSNLSIGLTNTGFFKSFVYGLDLKHINDGSIIEYTFLGDNASGGTAIRFSKTGSAATNALNKCIAVSMRGIFVENAGTMIEVKDAMESVVISDSLVAGVDYGLKLDYCIHVAVTNCHINAGVKGIYGTGAGASPAVNQLEISNCDIYCQANSAHAIDGSFNQFNIVGNTFYVSGGTGGKFIVLNASSGNGIISANYFDCGDNAITTFVEISSGATNIRCTGNSFKGTPTNYYVNSGGSTNRVGEGISISGTTTPPGGSTSYTLDVNTAGAYMGNVPNNVSAMVQNVDGYLVRFDPTDGAQTNSNTRLVFSLASGANVPNVIFRYGLTVVP